MEEVVVSASRVQRSGFTAPTPTTVLNADVLQARGADNVIDTINEIPAFRPTQTAQSSSRGGAIGASGGSILDLRGLNTATGVNASSVARTLVLVDRRRVVPSNAAGQIDLALIPTSLIARTDVVTGGASAAYGSDAVAGVVNLILKDKIQGLEGSLSYGQTDKNDNKEYQASLAAGTSFAGGRGHIIAGGEYVDSLGIPDPGLSRDWGKRFTGTLTNTGARPAGVPSRLIVDGTRISNQMTPGGIINGGPLANIAFGPGGVPFNFQVGTYVAGNQMIGGGNQGINFVGGSNLIYPIERHSALARVTYDFTATLNGFLELANAGSVATGTTASRRDAPPIGLLVIRNDNAFLPASVRAQMAALGLTSVNLGRISFDSNYGFESTHLDQTTNRLATGLSGQVFGDWKWDTYISAGQNRLRQRNNATINANYYAAIDSVVGPGGTIVCRASLTPTAPIVNFGVNYGAPDSGCVPFNVFGQNSPSQAAVNYVRRPYTNDLKVDEEVFSANIAGEPFKIYAGPVSLAAGVEFRREAANGVVDNDSLNNRFDLGNPKPINGSYNTKEVYSEVVVPVMKNTPLGESLDATGAVRVTNYSTSGTVVTWKVGASYVPVADLRFRVTQSRDIRAPNLNELYGTSFTRAAINGAQVDFYTTPNAALVPEKADTLTAGVVYQPSWFHGLRGSFDYYAINIAGVISTLGAQTIVDRCAAGLQANCANLVFTSTGALARINTPNVNLNSLKTYGFDYELSYAVPLESLTHIPGKLDVRWLATQVRQLATTDPGGTIDRAGQLVPFWSWTLNTTYSVRRLTANVEYRYVGRSIVDTTLIGPDNPAYNPALNNSISDNRRPPVGYVNLSLQYRLIDKPGRKLQIYGVANNILDTPPPPGGGDNPVGASLYDLIGRTFKLGIRFNY